VPPRGHARRRARKAEPGRVAWLWPFLSGMEPLATLRRMLIGLAGTLLGVAALFAVAHANEVSAGGADARGFVIHDAAETLRDDCVRDADGVLWFQLPGGLRWELVTDTADPAILNPGDGAFHPFEASEVRAALAAVRYPLERLSAEIYVLPYPRRVALESAAGHGLILLAPGVQPLTPEHQHAELIHELGHVVQYALLPDAETRGWDQYRNLRGITDQAVYNAGASHANRPHEIFAEDFRATFGDPLANYSGTIENAAIAPPAGIAGLAEFLRGLAGSSLAISAAPNPSRGATLFSRAGTTGASLDLFDPAGRRIATVTAAGNPGGTTWAWDGRDAAGRVAAAGVLFARVRGERSAAARFSFAP
jgi:hypothetical protein